MNRSASVQVELLTLTSRPPPERKSLSLSPNMHRLLLATYRAPSLLIPPNCVLEKKIYGSPRLTCAVFAPRLIRATCHCCLSFRPFCCNPCYLNGLYQKIYIHPNLFLSARQRGVSYICHQPCAIKLFRHTHPHLNSGLGLRLLWGSDACRAARSNRKAACADGLGCARKSPELILFPGVKRRAHTQSYSPCRLERWLATEVPS